jgi:Leucine-rich repeat (LRR) protein
MSSFSSLTFLSLNTVDVYDWPDDLLSGMNHLEEFYLKNVSRVQRETPKQLEVGENFFDQNKKLKTIIISGKSNIKFGEKVFQNLKELEELSLVEGSISSIPLLSENLKLFNISENELSELPFNLFVNVSKLKVVDLSGNRFEDFPEDLFANNLQLESVLFENDGFSLTRHFPKNFFEKNCELKSFSYSMTGNANDSRVHFPSDLFCNSTGTLSELKITHSGVDWTDVKELVKELRNLKVLDVRGNNIKTIQITDLPKNLSKLIVRENEDFECK